MDNLLVIEDLHVHFLLNSGRVRAVDGVNLSVKKGETLCLIGESGSGKSVLGLSMLRLLPSNVYINGRIIFDGKNLLELGEEEIRKIRGKKIAWVPQNPATSLNPVLKVGFQVAEPMILHLGLDKTRAWSKVVKLLDFFGIRPAEKRASEYPHQFSGGMRQRVLVAMGTSTNPELIIADEPTKGIDASKKVQVVRLFRRIREEREDVSLLLITHDLPLARVLADRIAVMYCGHVVEVSEAKTFFEEPLHPYSKALLDSLPSRGLKPIKGFSPSMVNPPEGCRFRDRCDFCSSRCEELPPFFDAGQSTVRCWMYA